MSDKSSFEKCLTFIGTQLESKPLRPRKHERLEPSVTISRETGAGGIPIAEHLAEYLQAHGPRTQRPWTVFDKNLVEQVLADHNLPQELSRYMPEDKISQISDMVEELLGLHPASWTLLRQTTETVLHLAQLGNVILVGRGANVITAALENTFHVRLVGSESQRVALVEEFYKLTRRSALAFVKKEDRGRRRFLRRYFKKDIDDPLLYHLIINTDRISFEEATRLIGEAVISRFY
ncbi:MAG: cytidylate kinase family protein [Verrucomicrobiota bacterium]